MIKKWKKLGDKVVYKSKHFKIRKDFVELPSRQKTDFDVLEYQNMVGVVAIKDKKILFVRQYRHPLNSVSLEIPAGFTDGQNPKKAAIRELEEETGYRAKSLKRLVSIHPLIGRMNALCHIYFTNDIEKTQTNHDEKEFIEIVEMDPEKVLDYIMKGKITSSVSVAGILYAQKKGLV